MSCYTYCCAFPFHYNLTIIKKHLPSSSSSSPAFNYPSQRWGGGAAPIEEESVPGYKVLVFLLNPPSSLRQLLHYSPALQPASYIMGFGDLKSASGLKVLNDFLADRSYIEGLVRSRTTDTANCTGLQLPVAPPSWLSAELTAANS